jgi:hypothetical protein
LTLCIVRYEDNDHKDPREQHKFKKGKRSVKKKTRKTNARSRIVRLEVAKTIWASYRTLDNPWEDMWTVAGAKMTWEYVVDKDARKLA